ncbi:PIN/TRAM domain-containing protein [Patescibacteria group bacterium]
MDTSVLIDGRILDVVKTGFLDRTLVIPSAVMNELHLISDSENKLKRERGRRGLDIVKKLKGPAKVVIPSIKSKETGVDNKLLEFCKNHKLKMMTQDFNLNKLAQASGVKVLNINELVEAVKVSVIPGEKMKTQISHEGKEKKQGVGYMPDGTMIIVQEAKDKVGQELEVKVTRLIQSPAGKIIFSELIKEPNSQ